jgi:hypothetical protein
LVLEVLLVLVLVELEEQEVIQYLTQTLLPEAAAAAVAHLLLGLMEQMAGLAAAHLPEMVIPAQAALEILQAPLLAKVVMAVVFQLQQQEI